MNWHKDMLERMEPAENPSSRHSRAWGYEDQDQNATSDRFLMDAS